MLFLLTALALTLPILIFLIFISAARFVMTRHKDGSMGEFKNDTQAKRWLLYRALALPALFILPLFFNHFRQFACPNPKVYAGPCYQVTSGPFAGWLGLFVIGFALIMLFSVRATWKKGKQRAEFAKLQLYVSIASVLVTLAIYLFLYQFSEGKALRILPEFTPPSQGVLDKIQSKPLGVGYPPVAVIVFSFLYLIAPFWQWLEVNKDRSKIIGIKKKELFQ